MQCPNCGALLADGSRFCPYCRSRFDHQPPVETEPAFDSRFVGESAPDRPETAAPLQDPRGMKWFKFVIYFQLFANALINLANAATVFNGDQYQGAASAVYAVFPAQRAVDIVYGVLCLGLAALGVYTRFRLSGFKRSGPGLYLGLIAANMLVPVLYMLLSSVFTGIPLTGLLDVNSIMSLAANVAMLVVNKIYFDRRSDLFVN